MTTAQIDNPCIFIKPSGLLYTYIKELTLEDDLPAGILNIISEDKIDINKRKSSDHIYLLQEDDHVFMNNLNTDLKTNLATNLSKLDVIEDDKLLNLEDLHWLYKKIDNNNSKSEEKIYFHEIFEGSEIILPKNPEIPRNPELERRCKVLKAQQQNRQYKAMTKNVDNVRQRHPEDTIAYQMNQLNRHLIAVGQFIISVIASFAFGFMGIELLVGRLDFGFRLLLGIICGLTVALAELYFLAKKLNEDMNFELKSEEMNKKSKIN